MREATTDQAHYSLLIQWSDEDQAYVVTLPEWSGTVLQPVTHGATYAEAAENAQEVLDMLVKEAGQPQVQVTRRSTVSEQGMSLDYDPDADAAYITLRHGVPFAFTHNVDDERNIDYGVDDRPIGVELLGVRHGVNLTGLPHRAALARLLAEAQVPGWDE
jgi:predicted RNase H-like HicB family nuclease/uncharacterized protein YuzE